MSERELSRLIESGETIPPGGLTEFVETEGGGIERRTCWDASTATIEGLFKSSANHCLRLRSLAPSSSTRTGTAQRPQVAMTEPPSHEREAVAHREINDAIGSDRPTKIYKTALGRNIDRLRKECGWSFDDFAVATGLDKTLIFGHVNKGKGAHPSTLERYATTFTEKLAREVTVAELEAIPRTRD